MHLVVTSAFVFDIFKLVIYIACIYLGLTFYANNVTAGWLKIFATKRFFALALLTLLVVGTMVFEDVISAESSPVDTAVLWFIRQEFPSELVGFFTLITLTGPEFF